MIKKSLKSIPPHSTKKANLQFSFKLFLHSYWPVLIFLFLLVSLAYFNSLGNDFVSDDLGILIERDRISSWQTIFTEPLSPLRRLLTAMTYQSCHINVVCYHLINVLFHIGNTFLVFAILILLTNSTTAFLAASLFATHPILTEAVTWITGGVYAQLTFFFLLSFLFYLFKNTFKRSYIFSVLFYILCLMSTYKAFLLFGIFYLYEYSFGPPTVSWIGKLKNNYKYLLPYTVLSIIWAVGALFQVQNRIRELNPNQTELFQANYFQQIVQVFSLFPKLLFWPVNLSFTHQISSSNSTIDLILFCLFLIALIFTFFRSKILFFWLVFFTLSMIIYVTPLSVTTVTAERYFYLGSIGFFTAISIVAVNLINRFRFKAIFYLMFVSIIFLLSFLTILRNQEWQTGERIAMATLRENPKDIVQLNFLGSTYALKGDNNSAIEQFKKTLQVDKNNLEATSKLAILFQLQQDYDSALEYNFKQLQIKPNSLAALQRLAEIYYEKEDYSKSLEFTKKELEHDPNNSTLYLNIGKLYLKLEDKTKARENFQKALELNPENISAQKYLKEN